MSYQLIPSARRSDSAACLQACMPARRRKPDTGQVRICNMVAVIHKLVVFSGQVVV